MLLATFAMTALLAAAPTNNNEHRSSSPSAMCVAGQESALARHATTNDQINAAEMGNPDSPDYRNRTELEIDGDVNAEWEALEAGNPDLAQSGNRFALAAPLWAGND